MRIKLNPFLAAAPLLMSMTVCMAAPIFSWESDTEGWGANGSNSVATSTTGATDGSQSLAVSMVNDGSNIMWWNAAATINLSPAQMQSIFTNATELKLDVTYPNPGSAWGNGKVEILVQGSNVGWTGLAEREVIVDGGPQTLTFPLTVAQAAGMASGSWGQIIFRTAYGNGGPYTGNVTMYVDNFTNTVVADPPPTSNLYWKGDVDNQWTSLNWTSDIAGTVPGGALPVDGSAGVAFTATGASVLSTELGAPQSVKSVVVTPGSGPITIGGSHNLTLGADGIWLDETAAGLTIDIDANGEVVLDANQLWKNKSTSPLVVNSVVSGAGSLTKIGAGSLRLGNANTYTGGTIIEQGTLALDNADALGGASAALTMNGGSLDLNGLNVTLASLTGLAGGAITNTSLTPSTLTLNAATDFSYNCQINNTTGGEPVSLVKKGTGTVTSSGGGTFTGNVTIEEGLFVANTWVFNVPNWSSFGNSQMPGRTITVSDPGSLSFTTNSVFGNASAVTADLPEIILNQTSLVSSRYNQIGALTLNDSFLDQTSSDTGNYLGYQFKGRIKVIGTTSSSIASSSGKANHLDTNTEFDVADVNQDAAEDLSVSAPLTNQSGDFALAPGGLTKVGSGTMVLTGFNTYTGDTTVTEGVLAVTGSSIVDTNKLVINGGKVDPSGSTEVVGSLFFGDVQQESGTWGATDSGADHIDDIHFTGSGVVSVVPVANYTTWANANGATDQTMDEDHDGDGVKNGIEYFMGQTGSTFTANPAEVGGTVTWPMDDSYTGVYGTDYEVQFSTDLVIWTKVDEGTGDNTVTVTAGTSVVYDIPTGGKSFVRLVVKN